MLTQNELGKFGYFGERFFSHCKEIGLNPIKVIFSPEDKSKLRDATKHNFPDMKEVGGTDPDIDYFLFEKLIFHHMLCSLYKTKAMSFLKRHRTICAVLEEIKTEAELEGNIRIIKLVEEATTYTKSMSNRLTENRQRELLEKKEQSNGN